MWEVRVTQKYTSDHGIDLEETVVFRVNNLTKAGVIVDPIRHIHRLLTRSHRIRVLRMQSFLMVELMIRIMVSRSALSRLAMMQPMIPVHSVEHWKAHYNTSWTGIH